MYDIRFRKSYTCSEMSIHYTEKDTLVFFYFGFTLDDIEKESMDIILKKVANKALFDATMQGAFNSRVKMEYKEKAKTAKVKAVDTLLVSVKQLGKNNEEYDDWHYDTCCKVKKVFHGIKDQKGNEAFTYGNAQKMVNMTMKYLYLLSKSSREEKANKTNEILNSVKNNAAFLHMPIDGYIIDALFEKRVLVCEECKNDNCLRCLVGSWNGKGNPSKKDCVKKWSRWDYYLYNAVKNQIFHNIDKQYENVIDWENDLWIEQAKKKKEYVPVCALV